MATPEEERGRAAERAGGVLSLWRSNAWTDLALTLPIFVAYHVGVVLLEVRNAADLVTAQLVRLAEHNVIVYWGLTLCVGLGLVAVLKVLGRGEAFDGWRFAVVAGEGVAYAVLMRAAAAAAVGSLPLCWLVRYAHDAWGPNPMPDPWSMSDVGLAAGPPTYGPGAAVVMSLGAGFYEEVFFRVGLFGLGALALRAFLGGLSRWLATAGWAVVAALVFSGWHYVGPLGDPFDVRTFVFRAVCGLAFTAIYVVRGFAPAVWTHALYDVWVLVLR
jgi:membrane protease YdiL (CAAX protease family)